MADMPTAGYSGTPLARKLGIKAGDRVVAIGAPKHYRELLAPLPDGVTFGRTASATTRIVHLFTTERAELVTRLTTCREVLSADAMVWVSWPKKASKVPTDITEDVVRAVALPMGWVDVKVCAVDEVWSGLKLVVRVELR
ncbi:DUF3052 domain-containing protein [Gemmatimonas aurantiaca]|uniref:DUF3052 domain-containing protein n=1 Tax=Gemmatimonas aurantiaca TaxID=173480 RepID=UPI00301CB5A4